MTLRDHFAGLAMQAIIINPNYFPHSRGYSDISLESYLIADAMLTSREKTK